MQEIKKEWRALPAEKLGRMAIHRIRKVLWFTCPCHGERHEIELTPEHTKDGQAILCPIAKNYDQFQLKLDYLGLPIVRIFMDDNEIRL